jgi:hypothetical protein
MTHDPVDIRSITSPVLAILRLKPNVLAAEMMHGATHVPMFQAVIDPGHISPSGDLIRFGLTQGDELTGWQRIDDLEVVEIIAQPVVRMDGEQRVLSYNRLPYLMATNTVADLVEPKLVSNA